MKRFAGLDVSLSTTSICVVHGQCHIVFEGVVTTDPGAIGAVLAPHRADLVGREAGPIPEWLHAGLSRHGLETELMETRHVHAAVKASLIKADRRDAYRIAQLLRTRSRQQRARFAAWLVSDRRACCGSARAEPFAG